jgi:hypothetical protein
LHSGGGKTDPLGIAAFKNGRLHSTVPSVLNIRAISAEFRNPISSSRPLEAGHFATQNPGF